MYGFGKTDKGNSRLINQDFIYVNNCPISDLDNLYIVADGIGGHSAGEVASQKCVEFFVEYIRNSNYTTEVLDKLVDAVNYSNSQVFNLANQFEEYNNMGTTILAVTIKNDKIYIVHVGDSRLYGIRNNKIEQMTTDHTYAFDLFKAGKITLQETETIPQKHILTRAIGTNENVLVDALFCDVCKDDIFILCSDGLSTMITNNQILNIINNYPNSELAVNNLINLANENGGKDNIAVIIIK